jgi:hypothetical protein
MLSWLLINIILKWEKQISSYRVKIEEGNIDREI